MKATIQHENHFCYILCKVLKTLCSLNPSFMKTLVVLGRNLSYSNPVYYEMLPNSVKSELDFFKCSLKLFTPSIKDSKEAAVFSKLSNDVFI